jgi:hypothetical protein
MKNHTMYAICINNQGYSASLEIRKLYRLMPDALAAQKHLARVIDESGEDYLYPEDLFIEIDLPQKVIEHLSLAV